MKRIIALCLCAVLMLAGCETSAQRQVTVAVIDTGRSTRASIRDINSSFGKWNPYAEKGLTATATRLTLSST